MRWKGFIPFLILLGLIIVIFIVFMDRWIETGLEKIGQSVTGARVEIDHLDFSVTGLSVEWQRLQVTNPKKTMQNVLETGRTAFRMNPAALLRKRIVIEEMALMDVRTGTPRETDGALPRKLKPPSEKKKNPLFEKAKNRLLNEVDNLPVMEFNPEQWKGKLNLDSLIVMADLSMPAKLDSAKLDIQQTAARWENFYQTFKPEADLERIKQDMGTIDPGAIKTIPELTAALKQTQDAYKTLQSIQDTVKTRKLQINTDFQHMYGYTGSVQNWYQEDYQRILEKARLPDLNVRNIGLMLFGSTVVHQIDQGLGYVALIRKYMPTKGETVKKEKPARGKGQNIHFPDRYFYPEFLIKKITISGQTGVSEEKPGTILQGEASGINSQPWIYGKPTEVDLSGRLADQRSLTFFASLDHTTEIARDHFEIKMNSVSLNQMQLFNSRYLPEKIEQGTADLNLLADFTDDAFDIRMDILTRQLRFNFGSPDTDNRFIGILHDVIGKMDRITLKTRITHQEDNTNLKLDSNLDDQISRELKNIGSKALSDAQNKVKDRLNRLKTEKMAEVNQIYDQKEKEIVGKIEFYEEKVDEQRLIIEAKIEKIKADLETRKKNEENKVKKKAGSLIKDVLD